MGSKKKKQEAKKSRPMRQQRLPGHELPVHPDVTRAAEKYLDANDESWDARKKFQTAKDQLIGKMQEHKLTTYTDPEARLTIDLSTNEKIKVRRNKPDDTSDEAE